MSCSTFGLKEIRFINSGHFPNEKVIIDDFTLLLGSSGVGKTTVMSAICYFYTMDKDKTRPLSKELSFYDWHLEGSYSHLIYVYENVIGRNLIILSKDEGKVKHVFVNVQNFEEDISTLYLDEDNRSLNLKEILANCSKNFLTFYKSETVATFRKMMCKKSYRLLPNKDKPDLDFSFYDSEESASIFGKYLFNIYSNSSVRDRGIKDMLISLIGEKEYSLDISEFKFKLSDALLNVSHFELIKDRRDRILNLDETIITYKALCDEINNTKTQLETIAYNTNKIKKVIDDKQVDFIAQQKIQNEQKNILQSEWKNKSTNYNTQIAELNNTIKVNEKTYNDFTQKYRIEHLISEQDKENTYEINLNELNIKVDSISSSIKELETKEEYEKQKARVSINDKKEDEKRELENKKDLINSKLLQLSKDKDIEIKTALLSLDDTLESKTAEYNDLDKKVSKEETTLALLPQQALQSTSTNRIKEELQRLKNLQNTISQELKSLTNEKNELEKQRDINFDDYNKKIQNEVDEYTKKKDVIKSKIDSINQKLDIGKNNLFGFLNKNNIPNKTKILAIASDEILFEEKHLDFSLENSFENKDDSFYGLRINGDIDSLASKYDISTLENSKANLQKDLDEIIIKHNIKFKNLEDNLKSSSNKYQRLIKEKSRELYILSPKIKDNEIKIINETKRLEDETKLLKEELEKNIQEKKSNLEKYKIQLIQVKEYISIIRKNKADFIAKIDKEYNDKENNLNRELNTCKQEIIGINKKYKKLIDDSDSRIHNTYNIIKESENIDITELESLQKAINQLNKTLKSIKDNKSLVLRYKDEVLPNYNAINSLKEQALTIKKQRNSDKDYFDESIHLIEDKLIEIEKNIIIFKNHSDSFETFKEQILQVEINANNNYEEYDEKEIVSLLDSKKYIRVFERYETLKVQQNEKEKIIILETGKIIDGIPSENMMKLKTKSDLNIFEENIEQYILIAKSYIDFIKTKFDIEGTSLQLHRLIEAINDAVSKISHIKGTFQSIVKDVNKINRTISDGIDKISVIDYIRLSFKDTGKDEIVSKIESIGDMLSANMLIGYENSDRSEQVKDELINIAQDLQIILDKTFKKNITVSDISTLTFDVSENAQVTKGIATLDSVGSNGTSIMIKAIIYITLLRMVTNKFANNEHTRYHCIIDEIGQISADYFTELMKYAKHLEFVFINGTAANDDDIIEAYPRIYMGTRESSNDVELTLIDTKDAMDDW